MVLRDRDDKDRREIVNIIITIKEKTKQARKR